MEGMPAYGFDLGEYRAKGITENKARTITNGNVPGYHNAVAYCVGNGQLHQTQLQTKGGALNCMHDQQAVLVPSSRSEQEQSARTATLEVTADKTHTTIC